jgi:hypothetical protein
MEQTMFAICYSRVATNNPNAFERQEAATLAYCAGKGYQVVTLAREVGAAGHLIGCPELARVREMLKRRAACVLIVPRWDHLCQNFSLFHLLKRELSFYGAWIEQVVYPHDARNESRTLNTAPLMPNLGTGRLVK